VSCGIYGYPPELAAPVALDAVRPLLGQFDELRFVFLDERLREVFAASA
jgi:O-acetyl-ADP-ribose deacetylase (regulator of RNase III)